MAGVDDCVTGSDLAIGLNPQQEVGGQWMGYLEVLESVCVVGSKKRNRNFYLIGGEDDVVSLQETRAKHVAEGVVFLVEGEDGRRGKTWGKVSVRLLALSQHS